MDVYQHRGKLNHTLQAIQKGALTVGFIGGSITEAQPGWNWPEALTNWLVETFPNVRLTIENAAISGTGSDLAVFRAERDLIEQGCDLVFVEYVVNDQGETTERRMRTREGLLRKLLRDDRRDVVLAHTYYQPMYADIMQNKVPATVAEFEQLAEHYHLGSVWMGLYALQEVMKGRMRWEEWLPDGLHPQSRGSLSYAQSVIAYLEKELLASPNSESILAGSRMPAPLNPHNWENAYCLPFDKVRLQGPWVVRNWVRLPFVDHVISTAAVGARLSFDFTGSGVMLAFDFGMSSAEFRYRLDNGEWKLSAMERPDWCPPDGWYRTFPGCEELERGSHTFEMEVVHGNPHPELGASKNYTGTNMHLALIGVIP